MASKGKPFDIKAADGAVVSIPAGDYYFNSKDRCRRMMLNSLSSDARRVYACLELATMGWQQELAVIMDGGEKRPLTPNDIRQQTGLLKQAVSRGLAELEDAGLAQRKAPDGGALRRANVLLYSWAVPRTAKEENSKRARLLFPAWFPPSWEPLKPFISHYKYTFIEDEGLARVYFDEVAAAARVYQEAEIVAARALEKVCAERKRAPASLYRNNGKNNTERTSSSASSTLVEATTTTKSNPAPRPPRTTQARFTQFVQQAFEGKGKGMPTAGQIAAAFRLVPFDRDLAPLVPWLADRIPRLDHAGGLKALVAEWVAHGPTITTYRPPANLLTAEKVQQDIERRRGKKTNDASISGG